MSTAVSVQPLSAPLDGSVDLPGDKSISHRAFLLNALGSGSARVRGSNLGADVRSTVACLRALGMQISEDGEGFRLSGRAGRLRCPSSVLDCGNSGTTMRLLAGILAAQEFTATLDGDQSLRRRPMARIAQPLRQMGARVEGPDNGEHPPLIITGARLSESSFELAIASAQLKSCLLLAAAASTVPLRLREAGASRDHTERLLRAMGATVQQDGDWIQFAAGEGLRCVDVDVPADPSALALLAAALCAWPGSGVQARGVLLNPTRAAFLDVLVEAGFELRRENVADRSGEPVGDVSLRSPGQLRPLRIEAEKMPRLIDEIPALAVVAVHAKGRSVMHGVAELRVKESDRVASIEALLRAFGVACGSDEDSLWIEGGMGEIQGELDPGDDHRMVMAGVAMALSAATATGRPVRLRDLGPAAVSFPNYAASLASLGVTLG